MRTILTTLLFCVCVYGQQKAKRRQDNFNHAVQPEYTGQAYNDQHQVEDNQNYRNAFQPDPRFRQQQQEYHHQPARQEEIRPTQVPIHIPEGKLGITPIPIIRLNKQQALDGSYKTSYETGNSIVAEETGFVKNIGVKGEEGLVQYGSYSYTDPEGRVITVRYTADEGGFRPEGDHLPTPPPVPAEVQKGLDIIFESIRQNAEKQAQNKQAHNSDQESSNYPASTQEDDGSYRPAEYI